MKLPFVLALGIARMGVMLAVFVVGGLIAGGGGAAFGYQVDVVHAVVGAPLAAVMFPIILLMGMVGWFLPATARVYARGGFAGLSTIAVGIIAATGGRHVAQIFVMLLAD